MYSSVFHSQNFYEAVVQGRRRCPECKTVMPKKRESMPENMFVTEIWEMKNPETKLVEPWRAFACQNRKCSRFILTEHHVLLPCGFTICDVCSEVIKRADGDRTLKLTYFLVALQILWDASDGSGTFSCPCCLSYRHRRDERTKRVRNIPLLRCQEEARKAKKEQ